MLGYHSKGTAKSTFVYSRDVMAWPIRHLGKTLRLVQKGMFDSDCTRSGYWTNQSDEMACDAFNLAHVALAEDVVSEDPSRKCSNPHPVEAQELQDEWEQELGQALNKPHGQLGIWNPDNKMNATIPQPSKAKPRIGWDEDSSSGQM